MNRRLTEAQALRGEQPATLTRAEWQALHDASLIAEAHAVDRTISARIHAGLRREAK